MNRKAYAGFLVLACLTLAFLTGCNTSSSSPTIAITATAGTPQSAQVGTAFATQLQATATSNGTAVGSGVSVTFTAPASGPSCAFPGGATDTETTSSSGVATSAVCTANTKAGAYSVTASTTGATTPASFSLTNTAGAAAALTATSGTPQSATVGTAFAAPLVATVVDSDGNPVMVAGVSVTFTAPASGASGIFTTSGTNVETDLTNASGAATSSTFTANAATGEYNVPATSAGLTSTNFDLANNAVVVTSNTYVFYLSGTEAIEDGPNFYAVAGAVTIDSNGNVLGGEEDYNDGFEIDGGLLDAPTTISAANAALTVDPTTGQGTLTLTVADTNLGVGGVETLGVQFVNASHALIVQFDGSATSSGSLDLQTSTSGAAGNFAFTMSGVNTFYDPVAFGGVYSSGGGSVNGIVDINDADAGVLLDNPFTGTVGSPDAFGRGTVTGTGIADTLAYYIVGTKTLRLISDDDGDSAVGSAFGQGTNGTAASNSSLGNSVFGVLDTPWDGDFATAGMFTTDGRGNLTAGVADDDEVGDVICAPCSIAGSTYSIASNGYGSLAMSGDGDITNLGIYLTDPNLNLNDPNNPSGGGGALVLETDGVFFGTGVVTPQTDTATADFTGNYAFGAQDYGDGETGWELDFVGQGPVADLALNGTGLVNDVFGIFGTGLPDSGVPITGTAIPDPANLGRYTIPLNVNLSGGITLDVAIYQASAGQLFWIDEDDFTLFLGPIEQQGSLTGVPALKKGAAKSAQNKKK